MNRKLVSLLKPFIFIGFVIASCSVYAEYYMVYPQPNYGCYRPPQRIWVSKHLHHTRCYRHIPVIKHHYRKHRCAVMHYRRRSHYNLSFYYVPTGYPSPCHSSCTSSCYNNDCCQYYQCPPADFVRFSGEPVSYYGTYDPSYTYDYQDDAFDRRTVDDVYPDLEINN